MKLEIYALIIGLYYDLNVDYATYLWEEFGTGISYANVSNVVSCTRYWSLILHEVYEKEGILVPCDVPKAEFSIYQHLKCVEAHPIIFPSVARITNVMLRNVDPSNPVIVISLTTINPDVKIGVLFPKGIKGTSK